MSIAAGGTVNLFLTKADIDAIQGTCFATCTLENGGHLNFDMQASDIARFNFLNECLKGNKSKYCANP